MRIISGLAKGRRLSSPNTLKVRPATDKVKESLFSILGDISEVKVLDLFAGTGSVGLEALSRGAHSCTFVEADRQIAEFINKNITICGFESCYKLLKMPVAKALPLLEKRQEHFDLIFIDPPYDKNLLNPTLQLLAQSKLLRPHSVLVCEHSPRELPFGKNLEISDQRKYGQTLISFLKPV